MPSSSAAEGPDAHAGNAHSEIRPIAAEPRQIARDGRWGSRARRGRSAAASAPMINLIFAIKFVHVVAAAAMFGTALGLALFMLLVDSSGNTSGIAVTSRFTIRVETMLMIPALALQPISGFPLVLTIGLSFGEFWI